MTDHDVGLDDLVTALRDTTESAGGEGDATRRRVFETLTHQARDRRRRVIVASIAFVFGAATMSWAATGDRFARVWERLGWRGPASVAAPLIPVAISVTDVEPRVAVSDALAAVAAAAVPAAPSVPAPPVRMVRPVGADDEARYRAAHELHFHGGDAGAALVAWDAYLARSPQGRFAIEARWNRALVLVRLGRHDEALAAIEPFARGELHPRGYRQREAIGLIAVLHERTMRRAP